MSQFTISHDSQFSSHASLAALVAHLKARGIFDELRSGVQLGQKTVKDSPQDKVLDILLTLLSGAQSLVQLNTLLRADPALQRAAGRTRCAEQSVAQQTLDAATAENVEQMQQVLTTLLRRHSQVAQHSFRADWLVLDVDLTGMPAGTHAEHSVKGYFSSPRSRRGRQQGRVLASQYGEIVCDALSPGNTLLVQVLPDLITQAEQVLGLTPVRRLALRSKSAKGQWHYAVLLFAGLADQDILTLMGQTQQTDATTSMQACLHFYDQRGGGIESSFGRDKSGLGITKRTKKRFEAQRLLMLLGTLAHNLLIWARRWLAQASPEHAHRLQQYGIKRMIRDLAHISGILTFDAHGRLLSVALFSASSLTKLMLLPLRQLLAPSSIAVSLDKT